METTGELLKMTPIEKAIEEMRVRKTQLHYTYARIAELSGLPIGTVQKVMTGATASPRAATIQALQKVFEPGQERRISDRLSHPAGSEYPQGMLAEPAPRYGQTSPEVLDERKIISGPRGPFTIHDYTALPDDQRAELIDGHLVRMQAPTSIHQEMIAEIFYRFKDYQIKKRPDCRVFTAPFDVQLDMDSYTVLQPDISVICDRNRITARGCYGAPDLIVEVLSDSTRNKDMYTKLAKYKNAGVREYWMVDPVRERVLVYFYEDEDKVAVYDFGSKIPVGISGGDLKIDFAEIKKETGYLL